MTEVSWLMPLLLLPGVALLIMSTSIRYGQIREEIHRLIDDMEDASIVIASGMRRRAKWFRDALTALYTAVALFVIGSVCGAVMDMMGGNSGLIVVFFACCGIFSIIFASILLIRESRMSLRILEAHLDKFVYDMRGEIGQEDYIRYTEKYGEYQEQQHGQEPL